MVKFSTEFLRLIYLWRFRCRQQQQKKKRRWWIHPIHGARKKEGAYYILIPQLMQDADKFFNFFRMNRTVFETLLSIIGPRFINFGLIE
jgi:ribosomal protein L20